jgi:hypothetical protein
MADSGYTTEEASAAAPDVVPPQVQPAGELEYRLRQQALLAELGRRALAPHNVGELLQEATRLVALGLETSFCKVLEYLPDKGTLLVRAASISTLSSVVWRRRRRRATRRRPSSRRCASRS